MELALEDVGALSQRAAVGDGARGLQPGRRRVAVLPARPRAVARVPLGRGRARRLLRLEAATVFRPGALEREGPDPEGAALRLEQCRGEPRRGREGVLLLSRFHADPLVHEVAVQVPPGRLPVRRPREDECAPLAQGLRVRARSTRGVFDDDRYFDVFVEYAKSSPEECFVRITVANRGPETATIHLLPTLWFRNTWHWWPGAAKPHLAAAKGPSGASVVAASHPELGDRWLYCDGAPPLLFTENETNTERLFDTPQREPVRQGRLPRVRRARESRRRQSGGSRHQGCRPLPPRRRCRSVGGGPALPHRCAAGNPPVRGLREDGRGQASRGGRVLPSLHAGVRQRGRRAHHAAGLRRPLLDEAVLLLRRQHVAPRARRESVRLAVRRCRQEPPRGSTCSTTTSSRCRTSGSTRGTPPGISPFTRSRWRASTRTSPSISST